MPGQEQAQCPCGTPAYRCSCECGVCLTARQSLDASEHQVCTRCERNLPTVAFSRRANGGLQSWCRECSAAHARERRQSARATGVTPGTNATRTRRTRSPFDRPFGLEIELIHPDAREVRYAMNAAGLSCEREDYNHTTRSYWKIVPDGSVAHGFEVVSPILRGSEGRRQARIAYQALRDAGASVDRSCGLHVHLEATDLTAGTIARVVSLWR